MELGIETPCRSGVSFTCTSHQSSNLSDQRIHQPLAIGVDAIAEENQKEVLFRVYPNCRPGKAAVAEGGWGEGIAPVVGIAGLHIPAEAAEPFVGSTVIATGRDFVRS